MARMFPNRILDETSSAAERRLYSLFRNDLGNEFTVFHSVAWLARSSSGLLIDGETDFVIAHPDLGLLVLEVKGGRIEYDGITKTWFSTDRYEVRHTLSRDPLEQAKSARYNLYRKLKDAPLTYSYNYNVYHAVSFPDITITTDLKLDLPQNIVLDQMSLADLERSIRHIYDFWSKGQYGIGPGRRGIDALVKLLAPAIELQSPLRTEFNEEEKSLTQLTQQQAMTLDLLSRERRVIVFGCAGSGKTMLAIEKARRLANEGFSVVLTCYNTRLAKWLNTLLGHHQGIKITNFHRLCSDMAKQARIPIPPLESDVVQGDEEYYFGTILPQVLMDSATKLGAQYNAIIVDEGQDFHGSWWVALEALFVEPREDIFYIFSDDNQNIYADAMQEYPFLSPSITLNTNCRNTQEIHRVVSRYYRGSLDIRSQGPLGRRPEIVPVASEINLIEPLRRILHQLTHEHKVRASEIVVLTPRAEHHSSLRPGTKLGNYTLTWNTPVNEHEIECCTIQSYKGLERPVVILAEMEGLSGSTISSLTYVGVSRARNHLVVIGELPD